jgi:O-palmitoleoyl-L-serine hydrolase
MDCFGRSNTNLGSTKNWPKSMGGGGLLSENATINPYAANFNRVYLGYCDGNSFSGFRDQPLVVNGKPLYMRGHAIVKVRAAAGPPVRGVGTSSAVSPSPPLTVRLRCLT